MASDLAIIHALTCSIHKEVECIGELCPYFTGKRNCVVAATEDAIHRLRDSHKIDMKYQKAYSRE